MQLNRNQIQTIIQNAPQGSDPKKLLDGLVARGYEIEGVDMNKARGILQEKGTRISGDNVGIGFNPTKEFTGLESPLQAVGKTVQNVPRSGFEFGKNIVSAVTNPIETGKSIFGMVKGAGEKLGRKILEKTSFKDQIPQASPQEESVNQLLNVVKDRYGSVDQFKETVVEDPVGALADIAGLIGGTGVVTKATGATRTGQSITNVANRLEPVRIAVDATKPLTSVISKGGNIGKTILSDIIPGPKDVISKNVVKALDWTQGDIRNFKNRSGTDVGDYLTNKQVNGKPLLANTVDETLNNVNELKSSAYQQVREAVSNVDKTYQDVPRVKEVLAQTSEQLKGRIGLETELAEINKLLAQEQFSLLDIQRVKEIIDERHSIYKRSGEPGASDTAQGLANVREDIKKFIEDEVSEATGGQVNIAQLNDDVRIAYSIDEIIEKNSTRDLTRNEFGLTDHILGTGLGLGVATGGISLLTGTGIFVAKKILENPTFRLSLAQGVKKLGDSKASQLLKELQANKLSESNKAILGDIINTAKENAVIINPALADLERVNSDNLQE